MIKPIDKIAYIQFEHEIWLNELEFYFEEIIIFTEKLAGFLDRKDLESKASMIEELIANFMVQKTDLETLMSDIIKHERNMVRLASMNGSVAAIINTTHKDKRKAIDAFTKDYNGLKLAFRELMEKLV